MAGGLFEQNSSEYFRYFPLILRVSDLDNLDSSLKQIAKNTKKALEFLTFMLLVVAVGLNWHCDQGGHSKPNERGNSEAHSDASPVTVGFFVTLT